MENSIGKYYKELLDTEKFKMKYYQCELKSGDRKNTVWLDEDHAIKGKRINILDSDASDIKWTIDRVYQIGLTYDNLKKIQEFSKSTR